MRTTARMRPKSRSRRGGADAGAGCDDDVGLRRLNEKRLGHWDRGGEGSEHSDQPERDAA